MNIFKIVNNCSFVYYFRCSYKIESSYNTIDIDGKFTQYNFTLVYLSSSLTSLVST